MKNGNPDDFLLREMSFEFKSILLDHPINIVSIAAIGQPTYMPPEKDVRLLEVIFIKGTNGKEIFDKNIGKKASITCYLRHHHHLDPSETTKVNCAVVSINPEPLE